MTTGTLQVRRSAFPPLLACVLALGIADSMIGPYLVLFGSDRAGLSPLKVGILMSLVSVSGLAVSTWLGRRYDRSASRWPAFVAVAAPAIGYLALTTTTSYPMLLLIGLSLLGAGMAAFPQVFSLARNHLDRSGGMAARRGTPALRSVWSLAWALGPLIGAALLAAGGYDTLMVVTAGAFALVAVPLALLGRTPQPSATEHAAEPASSEPHSGSGAEPSRAEPSRAEPSRAEPSGSAAGALSRPMLFAAAAFTFFHTAMLSGSVVLPLYVTQTLDRPESSVGLLFSVCAIVEIPAALATMLLPARTALRPIILLGMVLFAAYFVLVAASSTMALLIATQVARGIALAVVGALGITYVQNLAPHAIGRATTLYANTLTFGSLVSGVLAGATAQALGFRPALLMCAVLAVAGLACLALVRSPE